MNNKKLWLIAVIICLVSVSVYIPALDNGFVNWDDGDYVYDNPKLKAPDIDFVLWAFGTSKTGYWHPLTWLSLGVDYAFWEQNPKGYHLTSVLLHALNTMLVVLLAGLLLTKGLPSQKGGVLFGASVIGVLFGLHPFHVESVAWISERKDVLYAFFWLLSLLAYTGYASSAVVKRKVVLFLLCFMSFALSLASKPMAVTLPIVLLIMDFYPFRRLDQKGSFIKVALLEKLPFFLLSGGISYMTIIMQKKEGAMGAMEYLSLETRLVGAIKALGFYAVNTVWPVNLMPFYPLDLNISLFTWENLLSLVFILSVTVVSVTLWRRKPLFIAVWSYFLITLLPVLGIIQVGLQAMADRYMYLPILGPLMFIGILGSNAWERGKNVRSLFIGLFLFFSVFISVITVKQIPVWKDAVSLWQDVISNNPEAEMAYHNLGLAYNDKGDTDAAIRAFSAATQIKPSYSEAHYNLAAAYDKKGRTEDAIREYLTAIQIKPIDATSHNNLGVVYDKQGRTDDAIREYLLAIKIRPSYDNAHYNLGVAYDKKGLTDDAVKELLTAIQINPEYGQAHNNLGIIYARMGRTEDAIREFLTVKRITPDSLKTYNNLGIMYGRKGRTEEAINEFLAAIQIDPDYADAHYNLGITYKMQGRFEDAVRAFQTVLRLRPDHAGAKNNLESIRRMKK